MAGDGVRALVLAILYNTWSDETEYDLEAGVDAILAHFRVEERGPVPDAEVEAATEAVRAELVRSGMPGNPGPPARYIARAALEAARAAAGVTS